MTLQERIEAAEAINRYHDRMMMEALGVPKEDDVVPLYMPLRWAFGFGLRPFCRIPRIQP